MNLCGMFNQFFENSILPKSLASFFVALILKVDSPLDLSDFRPFISYIYKFVAKVLVTRLTWVMDSLISLEQLVFLKGRHLLDRVVYFE